MNNPVFLRPRRFGKSLFCSLQQYYYDLNYADQFDTIRYDDVMLEEKFNMRRIFIAYFNEIHHIDVSTRHTEYMQAFSNQPVLEPLFSGYW